ncbi:MAG: acyl--CoA ligase [Rhodospirillaceae bacterium]|jgi:long-chain acyl-CoA synthetase|nr:acyl--CoA ligase [Rhodospirillaceae bacterium]
MTLRDTANLGDIFAPEVSADKLALIDCRDWAAPVEHTYADLNNAANACARGLLARGFKPGDAIAMLSANRVEFITAYMGILRAGMFAVPINFKFPTETIQFIFTDSNVRAVICDAGHHRDVSGDLPVFDFDDDGPDGYAGMLDPGPFEAADPGGDGVAMVLYTSGSTGRPKGVPLTHAGHLWAHNFRVERAPDNSHHRLLVAAPLYHMNALCVSLFAFGIGATIVLQPEFKAERYIAAIERFGCTWITSVPTMLAMCFADPELTRQADLSSVKIVRMGSAPVSPKLWARVEEAFPAASIMNGYGTTEAGPVVFGPKPGQLPPPISVGWPSPGVRLMLADADGNEADQGDLWHLTPAIMPGYLNLPEKTAEAFSEDGLYKSGDVFRRDPDTGAYFFVGRVDDMFNCGGENIYPAEVEAVLVAHPDIEMACVVAVPDEIKGMKPVAFVVLVPGAELNEQQIKQHALDNAPAFQHPRMVTIMDQLPLAGPGKIDRNGLEARAREIWAKSPAAKAG